MPHSTAPFYKEDDAESQRMMGGGLESLALGLGMGGTMGGVGIGMDVGMGMQGMHGMHGMPGIPGMRTMNMDNMEMDMVEMGIEMDRMARMSEMGLGISPTATTAVMKEEEDPGSPSRERQAETEISASETTLALINVNANEPQFIFEFPGQDDENAGGTLASLNSNSNSNINSTHNTTFEHETISPSSENNNLNSTNNFTSIPLSLHSLDSYCGPSTYNTAALAASSSTSLSSATLLPTILDERHPLSTAAATISSSPLRTGSPTTESMRSMMSVFRVDPFASYDADAGSRRKRRKRGSSYAMLSDPEKTSLEEPLMFTFQIEASPGSEYYENYENYHHHHHHLLGGGGADIAGPSSAMVIDHALSTPSPHSSPSINILPPGSTDYYHQPSSSSSAAEYNPYLQSAVDHPDDFSSMILSSASTSTNNPTCGDTAPISSRSTTAFSHLYSGYTTPSRQSHPHHQSFHSIGMNPGTSHRHQSTFSSPSSSHHHHQHHPHQYHQHQHQSHSNLTLNPTQDTAYMLQNMRQSMGMHLGNLSNINVQGINTMVGMNTMSMPSSVAASLRPSYQPTTATPPASSPSAMNMSMPVQSPQQRTPPQPQAIGSIQVAGNTMSVNDAGHSIIGMQPPPPTNMDSISVSAVSHLDDIIDHLVSRRGDENHDSPWSTPSLPSHSSLAQSHHQRHPSSYYPTSQNQLSQNKNQGFGDALDDRDMCEGSGGGGNSSLFDNDTRKMRLITVNPGKRGESLESGYPNDPEALSDSQLNARDDDDEAEDITNDVDPASPGMEPVVVDDDGDGFQFGPLSPQSEIDAGGEPDGGNQGEAAAGNDRERNSKIRVGKLALCRASSPLVVALLADDGNNDESTDDLKNLESLKMEFGKPQKIGSEFKHDSSNAEVEIKPFARKESLLCRANPGRRRCREDVNSEEFNYKCKNEPDSSFSYFEDDNDAYSDVRKELFLRSLPGQLEPEYRTADSSPNTPGDVVNLNEACCASLKQPSSSSSSPTLAELVSYSYASRSSTLTLRTAFRLNAAQFDLDPDPDPDFDSHSHSPSEAEVRDVDMVAMDTNECCGLRLSNGSTGTRIRSMKSPGGGPSTDPAKPKVFGGDPSGESFFPTSFSQSVSSESTSTSTAAPEPRDSEDSCRENGSKSSNVVGHRIFPTSTTVGAVPALSLEFPSPQFRSQQAGPESSDAWKAFEDTTLTSESTSDKSAAAFTPVSSVSQHIPRQIQSQSPPLYKLQIKNTPNANAKVVANSLFILDEYSHNTSAPAPGVEGRIDYVLPKQHQDGTKFLLQATSPHSTTSSSFSFPSAGTGGSKMHICWICQKEFPRPSGLATHMNTHSGLKPYKCPIPTCSKTFAVRSNARRHLRIHGIGTNNSNLIFESSNSSDNSTYMYNTLHPHETSGPAYDHSFHPSSYYPSPHTLATSPLPASSSNEISRITYRNDSEQNRRDIRLNGRVSIITSRSIVSPPPDSLRHSRSQDSPIINRKGSIQNRCHPYRKGKAYSHFPSPHLNDDCPYRTPFRLASLPSDPSIIPYSYSSAYIYSEIEPLEMYQLCNEDSEVKTEFNVVLDDMPEENKMELADSEWDFCGSRLQEPGFNVELKGNGTVSGIEKPEELHKGPSDHNVGTCTTRNFSSNGEDHYSTISDIPSVVTSSTPTQRPTSTIHIVSRGGSISEIDTPTLSTVSTFSTDSSDLSTMAVASRNWITISPNTETASNHDLLDSGSGTTVYHPIASSSPSSSAIALRVSLSAYNLSTEPSTADRSLTGGP